jgi:hypothetical protein
MTPYAEHMFRIKFVKSMFITRDHENGKSKHKLIDISYCDSLKILFNSAICCCCKCFSVESQEVFEEGGEKLEDEIDLVKYVKGMRQLRVLTSDKLESMNEKV